MTHKINQAIKQSLLTFKNIVDKKVFYSNLEDLQCMLKNLSASDVGLIVPSYQDSSKLLKAPVSYIDVYECDTFTAGIFIIHKGMSIPLHDHPGMTGLCKILYGSVKVTSYDHNPLIYVKNENVADQIKGVPVKRRSVTILNNESDCEILLPNHGNYHAIHSIDGDAAMFDILAPPYSQTNDCQYYRELTKNELSRSVEKLEMKEPLKDNETFLIEVPQPMDFYCSSIPYSGPQIKHS